MWARRLRSSRQRRAAGAGARRPSKRSRAPTPRGPRRASGLLICSSIASNAPACALSALRSRAVRRVRPCSLIAINAPIGLHASSASGRRALSLDTRRPSSARASRGSRRARGLRLVCSSIAIDAPFTHRQRWAAGAGARRPSSARARRLPADPGALAVSLSALRSREAAHDTASPCLLLDRDQRPIANCPGGAARLRSSLQRPS